MFVEWTECTATCGGEGTQTQMYGCEKRNSNETDVDVGMEMCSGLPYPEFSRDCNRIPCPNDTVLVTNGSASDTNTDTSAYTVPVNDTTTSLATTISATYMWVQYNWSVCSASCGDNGIEVGAFECVELGPENTTDVVVSNSYCVGEAEPNTTRTCNRFNCVDYTYDWVVSDWSGCSVTCGEGVERVWYVCERASLETIEAVSASSCAELESPNATRPCMTQPCYQYRWQVSQWSYCSATCGDEGVQEVMFVCEQLELSSEEPDIVSVDSTVCSHIPRPKSTKHCNRVPCYELQWAVNSSECSESCGEDGFLDIVYTCQKMHGHGSYIEYVDNENCYGKERPEVDINCNRFPCPAPTYTWRIFDWAPCTHSCGMRGIKIPILNCQTEDAEEVDPVLCGPVTTPPPPRECDRVACLREWQTNQWSAVRIFIGVIISFCPVS